MDIMPAGVHHPFIVRCITRGNLFRNREGINIGTQCDTGIPGICIAFLGSADHPGKPGPEARVSKPYTPLCQQRTQELRGPVFVE